MARRPPRGPRKAPHLASRTFSSSFDRHDVNIPKSSLDVRIEDFGNFYSKDRYNTENNINNPRKVDDRVPNDLEQAEEEIRKNVWSDAGDDEYIAERNRERRLSEEQRVKRETSDIVSVSDSVKVVNSDKFRDMWDIEPPDLTECDCLGPPPEFLLPPPPRPPFLHSDHYCGDDAIPDLETCDIEPKIDAYNHSGPSLQTSAAIALCSIVLLVGILVGAVLVWKHKRKVRNLFPSKSSGTPAAHAPRRPPPPAAPLYEDLDLPRRTPLRQNCEPQLEMVESKRGAGYGGGGGRVFVCGAGAEAAAGPWRAADPAPLYEELPHRSDESLHSDDHFAEDELSLVGEACRACPPRAPHPPRARPRLERRRRPRAPDAAEFHEGVLLDALLRLYPSVGTVGARAPPPGAGGGAWPGGELPAAGCWRGPRASPKPPSGDSSFGSDSGYSNNTCGTCGTRASSRHRLSAEIPMS